MLNTFIDNLEESTNYKLTENGGLSHKTTKSTVYDMFAFGGAYRERNESDCVFLFKNAYDEDSVLALKCLFYLRDCRGGQGERRFFRLCFRWLANMHPEAAARNLKNVAEYGRWDDLIYSCMDTKVEKEALALIKHQLAHDIISNTPSLLAKWLPSENCSSSTTKAMARRVREYLGMTPREYRKTLSVLRKKINVLERLMSANEWDKIDFDGIPSRAGLLYKNAFARREETADRYAKFANNNKTKVNADVLYPYEVVHKALHCNTNDSTDRVMIEKYWNNLPDYLDDKEYKIMCVVDTSASMTWTWNNTVTPIDAAISLGMYCAERIGGPFKNHYISFSSSPQLIKIEGTDFVDKVERIYETNLCEDTDLIKTFELVRKIAKQSDPNDIPETLVVISDMEIDKGTGHCGQTNDKGWLLTEIEIERKKWKDDNLTMPRLVYWNVNARSNNILDLSPDVSFVSGCSPVIFEQIVKGISGIQLMLDKLNSPRYNAVK